MTFFSWPLKGILALQSKHDRATFTENQPLNGRLCQQKARVKIHTLRLDESRAELTMGPIQKNKTETFESINNN